jgi:CRISPR-associated protein Csb2
MSHALIVQVRFGDGRYHGAGDWPPAPARLFQALVAGNARGASLETRDREALEWLETLPPPVIATPSIQTGQTVRSYVPNNDLDAVDGQIDRIGEIRTLKAATPRIFDNTVPLTYAWFFEDTPSSIEQASALIEIAANLFQLGRGVDPAWATARIADASDARQGLREHPGPVWEPVERHGGHLLQCACPGSLRSLQERHAAMRRRFAKTGSGRKTSLVFAQPPKPRFRSVAYDAPPARHLFELRRASDRSAAPEFSPWPLASAGRLVARLRDAVAHRLSAALPAQSGQIERYLVGKDATDSDKRRRIRIIPLPSAGHTYVDHSIRRVLVEIPGDCPIAPADLDWALSGLDLDVDYATGEVTGGSGTLLVRAEDRSILRHYGVGSETRVWQSVTPVAVPASAARRRMDPSHLGDPTEWKGGAERNSEEARAMAAVAHALRHADLKCKITSVKVQREPFAARGARAESFSEGIRFAKERLWHVRVALSKAIPGPLVIGDGRYVGLGVMQPQAEPPEDIAAFSLPQHAQIPPIKSDDLAQATRRALMARARNDDGSIPLLFSGHEADGRAARSGQHRHIFIAAVDVGGSGMLDTILIAAPWAGDRSTTRAKDEARFFERVVSGFQILRAGRLGLLSLTRRDPPPLLCAPACVWESRTSYRPTRHPGRDGTPEDALIKDATAECRRRGLPEPAIDVLEIVSGPRGGVAARLRLRFAVAVAGPLMLGRYSHLGGGLFVAADAPESPMVGGTGEGA